MLTVGMICCVALALLMLCFVQILPSEEQIEAVQSAIFYQSIEKHKGYDTTKIDLN
jgi:hypothetical protein